QLDYHLGPELDRVPAVRQPAAADGGQRDGALLDRADHGADPVSGGGAAGYQPRPPRHSHDRQHGGRTLSPAGRPQPLRRVRHRPHGHHRAHHRRVAMAPDHADLPGAGDLHPGNVAVAAASAWNAVETKRRAAKHGHLLSSALLLRPQNKGGRMSPIRLDRPLACLLGAALWLASPTDAGADGLRAGQWQTSQQAEINGVAGPVQQSTRCLTPEAVADLDKTFSPVSRTTNSTCERVEHELTPQRLKWRLQCSGQIDMDVAGEFTFDSPE